MGLKLSGLTIIDRGGVDSDRLDLPLSHKPSRRFGVQTWEMQCLHRFRLHPGSREGAESRATARENQPVVTGDEFDESASA